MSILANQKMQQIEVFLPSMLADCVNGSRSVFVSAQTLAGAIQQLRELHPLLGIHVFDESGKLRRNVLIFYNAENVNWIEEWHVPLRPGDKLHVVPAVSGGRFR